MCYVVVFNFANGLLVAGIISFLAIPVQIFLFYLSRYKHKTTLAFALYALVVHAFFVFNYRFNGGISGPTLLSFISVYFFTMAIAERRHYWIWTLVHCSIVIILLIATYHIPSFVIIGYNDELQHTIDWASTYIVTVVLILAGLSYIVSNYQRQREQVELWASELDKLNDEKSRLLQLISHDYQSPLNAIRQYLDMLRRYEIGDEVRLRLESELISTLTDTQALLQNLLASSKLDAVVEEEREWCCVTDILIPILRVYSKIAEQKDI